MKVGLIYRLALTQGEKLIMDEKKKKKKKKKKKISCEWYQ